MTRRTRRTPGGLKTRMVGEPLGRTRPGRHLDGLRAMVEAMDAAHGIKPTPPPAIPERRKSRRYAIAFAVGDDITSVTEYQPSRREGVPLFQWDGSSRLFVALREGEVAPDDQGPWTVKETCYGYTVCYQTQQEGAR